MNIYYRGRDVFVKEFISRKHLEEYTDKYERSIQIESTSGYDNRYELIGVSEGTKFCVAIMYNWQGVEPNSIIIPELKWLVLSFECDVVWIDLLNEKLIETQVFPLPIYTIKWVETEELLVVVYEMGISVFDKEVKKKWEMGTPDCITSYRIEPQKILIKCGDDYQVTFEMGTGKVLN